MFTLYVDYKIITMFSGFRHFRQKSNDNFRLPYVVLEVLHYFFPDFSNKILYKSNLKVSIDSQENLYNYIIEM